MSIISASVAPTVARKMIGEMGKLYLNLPNRGNAIE
jgi:hypothetical protein